MDKILIIDDEPAVVELVEAKLRTSGYETLTATNGRDGIEAAHASNPNLVLLDILMPEIDGFEVCRRLKADKETESIPIMFLSGKLLERDVVKGLELGADDYIIKPFSPRELVARIKHILESRATPKNMPSAPALAHLEQKIG
ncbi:MAG: response regulator, partial [Actinomycetota bacterium]|nr:response regulator [Actinomycetota bacterium]